jgi:CheY-like chemotaxis protein/thioesterase domain-containing protein
MRRPIVLIQGFASSSRVLGPLERRLRSALGRPIVRVALGGRIPLQLQDIRESAHAVDAVIRELARAPDFEFCDIVGHSMGGLVATYVLKRLAAGRHVRRVVTLGTPHRGTPAAAAGVLLFGLVNRAVWQMLPGSALIRELEESPVPDGAELLSIAGGDDALVPSAFTRLLPLPRQRNIETVAGDHFDLILAKSAFERIRAVLSHEAARRSVLVVDDDATLCEMLEAILTDNGFGSLSVRDVDSALSVLARDRFDAILSDIRMPGKSGFELAREVTRQERKAPVLLMSSFAGEQAAVEAREAGAADFVCKPFPPSELVRRLDRAIATREAA